VGRQGCYHGGGGCTGVQDVCERRINLGNRNRQSKNSWAQTGEDGGHERVKPLGWRHLRTCDVTPTLLKKVVMPASSSASAEMLGSPDRGVEGVVGGGSRSRGWGLKEW
jgi:hypothetical protein